MRMNLDWPRENYLRPLNELSKIDRQLGKETGKQFEKSLLDELNQIKDPLQTKTQDS